jgi:hypothetical protein
MGLFEDVRLQTFVLPTKWCCEDGRGRYSRQRRTKGEWPMMRFDETREGELRCLRA